RLTLAAFALLCMIAPPAQAQDSSAGRGGRGGRGQADPRDAGGGQCANNSWNCMDAANPIPARNTVWMEEMTWMDVRDAIRAGKTTAIIATGGMEPNGPWLVTGKHNYVTHANCEAIARKLGNALCAPLVKFVPEGNIDPPTSHMRSPGTISMREETFRALLTDIVASLKMHGFTQIFLIGDSGGNQAGQRAVADSLNRLWNADPLVAHVQEYYTYAVVADHMEKNGLVDTCREQLHDDPVITLNMFIDDPRSIKYDERVKAGRAKINGIDISDRAKATELARKIVDFRAQYTIDAMHRTIANKGTLAAPQPQRGGGRAGAAGGEAPPQLPVCSYTGK
ncbi:MAG: creatininase family protein, partial [Gemmatimonadota bacterium]|nr:creatininase family protein [Gemmatimonadota bacterium]